MLAILAGIVGTVTVLPVRERLPDAIAWVRGQGALAPLLFVSAYILGCILFVPGSALTLAAGILFGPVWGTVYTSIASTLGATVSFLVGRFLARDWVADRVGKHPRFGAIDNAIARKGWLIVLLLRLSPLFPFSLLNYGLGLTRIPPAHYALASWAGMLPGTIVYVWFGSVLGEALLKGADAGRQKTGVEWALQGAGLLATLVVTVYVTRLARQSLSGHLEPLEAGAGSSATQNHP